MRTTLTALFLVLQLSTGTHDGSEHEAKDALRNLMLQHPSEDLLEDYIIGPEWEIQDDPLLIGKVQAQHFPSPDHCLQPISWLLGIVSKFLGEELVTPAAYAQLKNAMDRLPLSITRGLILEARSETHLHAVRWIILKCRLEQEDSTVDFSLHATHNRGNVAALAHDWCGTRQPIGSCGNFLSALANQSSLWNEIRRFGATWHGALTKTFAAAEAQEDAPSDHKMKGPVRLVDYLTDMWLEFDASDALPEPSVFLGPGSLESIRHVSESALSRRPDERCICRSSSRRSFICLLHSWLRTVAL